MYYVSSWAQCEQLAGVPGIGARRTPSVSPLQIGVFWHSARLGSDQWTGLSQNLHHSATAQPRNNPRRGTAFLAGCTAKTGHQPSGLIDRHDRRPLMNLIELERAPRQLRLCGNPIRPVCVAPRMGLS